jgi:hypothetical protein
MGQCESKERNFKKQKGRKTLEVVFKRIEKRSKVKEENHREKK